MIDRLQKALDATKARIETLDRLIEERALDHHEASDLVELATERRLFIGCRMLLIDALDRARKATPSDGGDDAERAAVLEALRTTLRFHLMSALRRAAEGEGPAETLPRAAAFLATQLEPELSVF